MHFPYYETRRIENVYLLIMYLVMVLLVKLQLQSHDKVAFPLQKCQISFKTIYFSLNLQH